MRPVSKTVRRQLGAFDNLMAIAAMPSTPTCSRKPITPSRSRTQTCVSSIEISEASEIVHINSPLRDPGQSYRPSRKSSRPLPDVEKLAN